MKDLNKLWMNVIDALRGKSLVYGGLSTPAVTRQLTHRNRVQRNIQTRAQLDPILAMDLERDADLRLQRKFEEIKREERGLVGLILGH